MENLKKHASYYTQWMYYSQSRQLVNKPVNISKGRQIEFKNKKLLNHRKILPAYINDDNDRYIWYKNGLKHRLDGPSLVWDDGSEVYSINGKDYAKEAWKIERLKYVKGEENE